MSSCLQIQWYFFFFSSRRRHTRFDCDWSSDVCSSDLASGHGFADGTEADDPQGFAVNFTSHKMHRLAADRKSTRLNSSHSQISYAVFCLKKKKKKEHTYDDTQYYTKIVSRFPV